MNLLIDKIFLLRGAPPWARSFLPPPPFPSRKFTIFFTIVFESYFSIKSSVILVTTETLLSNTQVKTIIPDLNFDLILSELFFKSLGSESKFW